MMEARLQLIAKQMMEARLQPSREQRSMQIARDGSILRDRDEVYVIHFPLRDRIDRIDYFYDWHGDSPMAELWRSDEIGVAAIDMVPLRRSGNTVKRITVVQHMWRIRLWNEHIQPDLIQLAHDMVKVYEEARKFGWIVPSLDYERKLAERLQHCIKTSTHGRKASTSTPVLGNST